MKEIRLLQIVPALESGGVEQGAIDVANFLGKEGHYSFIASNGGRMQILLNKQLVKHFDIPANSKNPFVIIKNIKRIHNIIKNNQINLVHVRSRAPAWSLRYVSKLNCKTVSTFHNVYGHKNFLKIFYNSALSKVDKIVAISNFVKSSIINLYKINEKKITVIYRGIDTQFFDPSFNDEHNLSKFILKYNIPNNKKIILYPGRLTDWKGQLEFLEIIESLDISKIICYFIGDDKKTNYKNKLLKEITKRKLEYTCKIFGHCSKEDLRFMYKIADVVVSAPTQPEGFGRSISEGLSMKKIVLCYNYGGAEEQIFGLDTLFSVKPNDKSEMIKKIKTSLDLTNNKINQIGEISRKHVIEKFSKKIMIENYFKFYKEII